MPRPAERVRERIRHWLEATGLTFEDFAVQLHRTRPWLDKVLQGVNHVRLDDLDDLAAAMRTTAAELVRSDDDRYRLDLSPTELRIVEQIRHRPDVIDALSILLNIRGQQGRAEAAKATKVPKN